MEKVIIVIIMCLFLFVFIFIEPLLTKHKVKNDHEYGSARFATFKEIKRLFKCESVSNILKPGFPVYYSKDLNNIYFDRETPHYVYLGSTGSGKSVTAVIPTCSFIATAKEEHRSVFITDPKGEIFEKTSKMFKDKGYEILTIDFRKPELSNKINLLSPLVSEYNNYLSNLSNKEKAKSKNKKLEFNNKAMKSLAEVNRLITSIADTITQEKVEQKDPFWNNSAKNLLEGLIGLYLEELGNKTIKEEQVTLTSIRKFQNSTMETKNQKKFKEYINTKEYGSKSKDSLTSILSASENTYKSITAVFGEKMSIFDDINVANVTSSSDFKLDILGRKKTAMYVIVPDEDKTYFKLVTMIVGMLYRELVKLANESQNGRLPIDIDFILDEFANCPPLPDIESMVSASRSRGMHFHFFIQSFSQLDNVYGKDVAKIILDNCGLIYLKTNTQETAEVISKRLGKKTIESGSIRQSVSLMNYNGDKTTNLIGRDLMTPEEVISLHYKTIIFPIRGYPIYRDTVMYNKFKCYIKGCVDRNIKPLEDLAYTYFTVEKINYVTQAEQTVQNRNKEQEEQKEWQAADKMIFDQIQDEITNHFKKHRYKYGYKTTDNGRLYEEVVFEDNINELELSTLKAKFSGMFHIEKIIKDGIIILEIHNETSQLAKGELEIKKED